MPLKTIEPHGLSVIVDGEWVEIDVAIDSGAVETVISTETLAGVVNIIEGPAFTRGVKYEVANGIQIPNQTGGELQNDFRASTPLVRCPTRWRTRTSMGM